MVINSISFWETAALFGTVAAEFYPPISSEQMLQCPRVLNSTYCILCKVPFWLVWADWTRKLLLEKHLFKSLSVSNFLSNFISSLRVLYKVVWSCPASSQIEAPLPYPGLFPDPHSPPHPFTFLYFSIWMAVGLSLECYCWTRAMFLEETYPSFPAIKQ